MPDVLIAMSGGVDSTLAACLIREEGVTCAGIHLDLGGGQSEEALAAAHSVGIPLEVLPAAGAFEERVLRPAWEEYALGRTPNPCVRCNRVLKTDLLLQRADEVGARWIATGHYARVQLEPEPRLLRGLDSSKDQSYFLASLTPDQLTRLRLPLGGMTKDQVRRLARERGLAAAERPESQDTCLALAGDTLSEHLRQRFEAPCRPGRVLSREGELLGKHRGVHHFTIGQRRGLGVSLGAPAWVYSIDGDDVSLTTEPRDLLGDSLLATGTSWLVPPPAGELRCEVKVRYRSPSLPAVVRLVAGGDVEVSLLEPARAITPGQAVVFYAGEQVLGAGWIREAPEW